MPSFYLEFKTRPPKCVISWSHLAGAGGRASDFDLGGVMFEPHIGYRGYLKRNLLQGHPGDSQSVPRPTLDLSSILDHRVLIPAVGVQAPFWDPLWA